MLPAVILAILVGVTRAAKQDPFYEIMSSWQDNFKANFCLTAPQDLFGWKVKVNFDKPVTSMQIYRADVRSRSSDSTGYHFGDQSWNARWLTGERNCFQFVGSAPGLEKGAQAMSLNFADIIQPSGCPEQIPDQLFSLDITSHWSHGISATFCLRVPQHFDGDWKVRLEFDKMVLRVISPNIEAYNTRNRVHWMLIPTSTTAKQKKGDNFCPFFTAFTRRMINPCIRAFFTERDGIAPFGSGSFSTTTFDPPRGTSQDPPTGSTARAEKTTATTTTPASGTTASVTTASNPATTQRVSTTTDPALTTAQRATTTTTSPPTTDPALTTAQRATTTTTSPPTTDPALTTAQRATTTTTSPPTTDPALTTAQRATTTTTSPPTTDPALTTAQRATTTTTSPPTTTVVPPTTTTTGSGSSGGGWSGTYTEKSIWNAGVNGELCLARSMSITCGWEVEILFDPAVDRLDIWKGQTKGGARNDGSANVFKVESYSWSQSVTNDPYCLDFNAYKSYTGGPKVTGRFTRICADGKWSDVTGGSAGGVTPSSGQTTTPPRPASSTRASPASTTAPSGTNPPDKSGLVNQDMLDLYKNTYPGDGTYYGEGREGTCTYDQTNFPPVGLATQLHALAALNYVKWFNSKACGMCFKVTGKGVGAGSDPLDGTYYVFVKDLCPGCSQPGSVDFAENKDGRWDIEIQAVQCPVGKNKLQYAFQGTNPWYIKLQIRNYRIPPNQVWMERNGMWKELKKSSDGYWLLSDSVEMKNTINIPVRITGINGEKLEDTIPRLDNNAVMDGGKGVQFAFDPSLPYIADGSTPNSGQTTPPPPPPVSSTRAAPPATTASSGTNPPDKSGLTNQDMLDLYKNTYQGDGTYYGEGREGTCTYDQTNFPPVGLATQLHALAALNYIKWFNSKACGMCFKVTGKGVGAGSNPLDGTYYVFVKDLCPSGACSKPGSVDFAENKDGRWDIEIQAVQCPVGNNKLQYSFQGSNPWYIKLQVRNYRLPPNQVWLERNGVWQELSKSTDGYWLLSDSVEIKNTINIPVRVTGINGEKLEDTIPRLENNVVMDGGKGVQFALDPSLPYIADSSTPTSGQTTPPPPPPVSSTRAAPPATTASSGTNPPDKSGVVNQDMVDLYKTSYMGDGTYYGEGRDGTCTYDQTNFPPVGLATQLHALAALNYIKWFNSKACGMCFKVTGKGVGAGANPLDGTYYVFVKDLCPSGACSKPGSVDFAENKDGRWDIEIQAVQCPVGNNKLQYSFQGSNPWYIKLQVRNYRIPPNQVWLERNGVWKELTKSSDGYWLLTDSVEIKNTLNIPVRVTAINGEKLEDTIPRLVNDVVMDGGKGVQFALDPTLPSM